MAEETKDPKETEPVKAEYIMPKAGEGHWQDTNPTLRWKYFTGVLGIIIFGLIVGFCVKDATLRKIRGKDRSEGSSSVIETNDADALIAMAFSTGQYEACGPEQLMWTHHSDVYGGFSGCVGENGYNPCAQDGFGGDAATGKPYLYDATTETCDSTTYTWSDRMFWVLWGHPQDKYELTKRTGLNPVISFPFNRGPYPSMLESGGDHGDDAADARATAKDLLVYLGAFTETEVADWSVSFTEGAEQGHIQNLAAAATLMARATCNRDIYILMEAPAYGYDTGTAAWLANKAGDFKDCANDTDVTLSVKGWLPGTALPTAVGADGLTYSADSTSENSPWLESMVFPENPSGVVRARAAENTER